MLAILSINVLAISVRNVVQQCTQVRFAYLGSHLRRSKAHFSAQDKSYLALRNVLSAGTLSDRNHYVKALRLFYYLEGGDNVKDILNSIEVTILDYLYKRDYENNLELVISNSILPLIETDVQQQSKEVGFYLEKLKRLNYLEFEGNPFTSGGRSDSKYRNNIIMIWWDKIHITYKGRLLIEEIRQGFWDKVLKGVNNFIRDIVIEIRNKVVSHTATFILGIICAYFYYLIIIK